MDGCILEGTRNIVPYIVEIVASIDGDIGADRRSNRWDSRIGAQRLGAMDGALEPEDWR